MPDVSYTTLFSCLQFHKFAAFKFKFTMQNILLLFFIFTAEVLVGQTNYVGGSASARLNSQRVNTGLFQNSSSTETSFLLSPEYGIMKEHGNMFGLSIGGYYQRTNSQGNVNSLFAAVFGFNYRKLLGDKLVRPLVEAGVQAYIGQENPASQGQEFFSGSIPVRAGILYEFLPQWNLVATVDVFGFNYTRLGSMSQTRLYLMNDSMVHFSVLRTF